jgi:hypothetical protein
MSSPPRSFSEDFAGLPLTRIRPLSMSSCTRKRESSGQWAVTNRSSRIPASVSIDRSSSISGWAPTGTVRLQLGRLRGHGWRAQGGGRTAQRGLPAGPAHTFAQEHSKSCRPGRTVARSRDCGGSSEFRLPHFPSPCWPAVQWDHSRCEPASMTAASGRTPTS